MHVRIPERLTAQNIDSTLPEFSALPIESHNLQGPGLTSPDYNPNTWINIARVRETFDLRLGGPEGFDKWAIDAMMIRPDEAYGTHNTVSKVFRSSPMCVKKFSGDSYP